MDNSKVFFPTESNRIETDRESAGTIDWLNDTSYNMRNLRATMHSVTDRDRRTGGRTT